MFELYTALITGILLVTMALVMKTQNGISSFLFKVIPFFLGVANLIVAARGFGLV